MAMSDAMDCPLDLSVGRSPRSPASPPRSSPLRSSPPRGAQDREDRHSHGPPSSGAPSTGAPSTGAPSTGAPSPPPSLSPGLRDSYTDSEDSDGNISGHPRKNCKTAYKKSLMKRYCKYLGYCL